MRSRVAAVLVSTVVCALLALPAAAHASGSAYLINPNQQGFILQYSIGPGGQLSPLTPPTVLAPDLTRITISPDGRWAYSPCSQGICQGEIDPLTGALSQTSKTVGAGDGPTRVAVTPDGRSAYITNAGDGTISQYDVDPRSGALSPKAPASVPAGLGPFAIALTPDGKSAYVLRRFSTGFPHPSCIAGISQYDIDARSGALSPKTPPTITTRCSPSAIAVNPDGRSAYITEFPDKVLQYDIDPGSGALSPKTPPSVVANPQRVYGNEIAEDIVVTPDGKSVYVLNTTVHFGSVVSQFNVDPRSGALSPKTSPNAGLGSYSVRIVVAPDGSGAYVTNTGRFDEHHPVDQFTIDSLTGALSPATPPSIDTGLGTAEIAVGALPRKPAAKEQCQRGGWHNYPQFKNQGQCVAFVAHGR